MIRCVVLDFDGTVVLSNDIKREGFFAVVSVIPDGGSRMVSILSNPPGDRYAIFDRFAAETGTSSFDLLDGYSNWCEERILQCPERHGAERLILALRAKGIKVHLNSATPTTHLRSIVARRFGMDYFDGVYGGHGEKAENLKAIIALEAIRPDQLVMIGDGVDDRDAANIMGCRFIGVPDGTLASADYGEPLVGDFDHLWSHLLNGADDNLDRE